MDRVGHRQLRGEVDHAAGTGLAIQHRGRSLQHVDALEQVRVDLLGRVEGAVEQLELVEELVDAVDGVEAANADLVVARREASVLAGDARCVAQCFPERAGILLVKLCACHHRDRLRRVDQRGVGLGCRVGVLGHQATAPVADDGDDLRRTAAGACRRLLRAATGACACAMAADPVSMPTASGTLVESSRAWRSRISNLRLSVRGGRRPAPVCDPAGVARFARGPRWRRHQGRKPVTARPLVTSPSSRTRSCVGSP